jgi:hypothetical protein
VEEEGLGLAVRSSFISLSWFIIIPFSLFCSVLFCFGAGGLVWFGLWCGVVWFGLVGVGEVLVWFGLACDVLMMSCRLVCRLWQACWRLHRL